MSDRNASPRLRRMRSSSIPSKRKEAPDGSLEDVVCFSLADSAHDSPDLQRCSLVSPRHCRPLPTTTILQTMADADPSFQVSCPLLQDYLRSIGQEKLIENPVAKEGDDQSKKKSTHEIVTGAKTSQGVPAIDDVRNSTLTQRQHQRFLELSMLARSGQPVKLWKERMRKEFYNLRQSVQKEQEAYSLSLQEFWQEERERLLIGFSGNTNALSPASSFVGLATRTEGLKKYVLDALPNHHVFMSKCCQIVSLPPIPAHRENSATSFLDSFDSKTLDREVLLSDPRAPLVTELPQLQTEIPAEVENTTKRRLRGPYMPLRDDCKAMDLANQWKVDVLTTADALRELLRDPERTRWLLAVERHCDGSADFTILEAPVPQAYSSPRDCLSEGLEEGLICWMAQRAGSKGGIDKNIEDDAHQTGPFSFSYTLWRLPQSRSGKLTVLVRDCIRLRDGFTQHAKQPPLKVHARVEYFPEKGEEVASGCEKALWLLDYVLHPEGCTVLVGRVDPKSCKVLSLDQVSRAHALVEEEDSDTPPRLENLWQNMTRVLSAVPTLGSGHHFICSPARDTNRRNQQTGFISVHRAIAEGDLRLLDELDHADQVSINASALQSCFRPWKWQAERTRYTYPPPAN